MPVPIRIRAGDVELEGRLDDNECGRAVAAALPWRGEFRVWGDQFTLPLPLHLAKPSPTRRNVEVGDLGYWPEGAALCIFCGPTPLSPSEAPVLAEPIVLIGSVDGAPALRRAKEAQEIVLWAPPAAGPEC